MCFIGTQGRNKGMGIVIYLVIDNMWPREIERVQGLALRQGSRDLYGT